MEESKIMALRSLIEEYIQSKGTPNVEQLLKTEDEQEGTTQLSAIHKMVLQQMIRERAKRDEKDIDELIKNSRKEKNPENPYGQVLGSLSKVEVDYIQTLLEEASTRQLYQDVQSLYRKK